ncbi:PREDICTED: uncharacterized protein LOC100634273, partial [Amphimedon queenslandica]|uniref:Sushi domain-containing protein n=2 Tax=Amphimedon queenslandica TaxID=400682 RepID=A0AAN0J3P2_AMPQE
MSPKTLLFLFCVITLTSGQSCLVGDTYSTRILRGFYSNSNVQGKWFLNLNVSANCSGAINNYTVQYFGNLNSETSYDLTIAIWKPLALVGSFEKDSTTVQYYTYPTSKRRKRDTLQLPNFGPLGIRKGSVVGVYLDDSNPLRVIGQRPEWVGAIYNGVPIGACASDSPLSATILNCNESNFQQFTSIHIELYVDTVECGTPPIRNHSMLSMLDGDTEYGAQVQYTCNSGYNNTAGADTISCQLNGTWSSLPIPFCTPVNCTDPGTPTNGTRNGMDFFYNSTVSYSCNTGYNLTGAASITCNATGLWSAPLPSCPPVNCGDPGTPDGGSKSSSVYTYNSVVSFQCNSGYFLSGSVSLICLSDSSWNGSVPSCLAGCGDPGVPENGQRQSDIFSIDSAVSFTCDTGYTLTGSNSLLCLAGGSWNDTAPTCNPVNCGDPGTLTNGTRNGTVFTFNSTVLYSCDTGYTITGATSLTCLSNGLWDASVPSCDIVNCSNPGEPTNGMLQGGTFTYNSVVTYNCSVGYSLTGTTSLTCLADGTWNTSVPSCPPVNCGDPGTPTNGSSNGSVYTYNSVVSYQCISGYSISGADTLSCLSTGSWNGSVPYCYPDCTDPGDPSNGQRTGDTFNYNSVLSYTCNTGYNLTGESSITCLSNGSWSNMIPSCIIVNCSDPGTPTNGERFGDVFTYGAEVVYSCSEEYSIVGAQVITFTGIRYTSRIGACVSKNSASATTITCSFNHYYVVHAEADVVVVDCGTPPLVLNAAYSKLDNDTQYGARVQYNCSTGYNINGNDTISCLLNASWSLPTPSCSLVDCGNPGEPANGYTNNNVFTYQSTVQYHCNEGYQLSGDSSIECTATGQWSNNIPLCIASTLSQTSTSSTVMPTTPVEDSNTSLVVIGGVIGAVLFILIILIVAILLIVLLVARSKRNSRHLNTTNLTNPIIAAPSEEHPTSDYDDPALTLRYESVPLLYSELESLETEDDSKYSTEEIYDNENIANVVLPPSIYLDADNDTSLYFIQEAEDKDKEAGENMYPEIQQCYSDTINTALCTLQACNVGDDYEAQNGPVNNNIGGKWYLNVAVPATCSGSIESYQVQFYDDDFKSGRTYGVTLSVWRPIANNPTSYEKDSLTIQQYQYQHTNKRRRKRAIIASSTPTFSSAVGVRRGSVIGVYLSNPNPLEVIGDRPDGSDINGVPVGVCVTTASASTSTLTCTGSNQPSYVMHAEANISVVDCGAPPSVLNATHSQLDGDTEYGARVQYNCDTGYNINGNDIISCLLNASWFLPTPSCSLVDCGNPGEPANGYTNDNVFTYQSTVQYHCNEGYQLSGDSSIECTSNGNWNNTLPNCVIINCTDPGIPTNGERTGVDIYYNSTVSYSCNTGYNSTGAAAITCLATGLWIFSDLYGTIPNQSKVIPSDDYDEVAVLKHQSVSQTASLSHSVIYAELEDLETKDENRYPIEEIYDGGNIADVVLPPPILLDVHVDDGNTEGLANSLYFIPEDAEGGATFDENAGNSDNNNLPVYFTLENENKTVPKFNARKLAKRNTCAFIQPGESEDEIYGQIE